MSGAAVAILVLASVTVLTAWVYFRNCSVSRLPISTFSLSDVAALLVGNVVIPYLYLGLPTWMTATLLGLGMVGILDFAAEPIVPIETTRRAGTPAASNAIASAKPRSSPKPSACLRPTPFQGVSREHALGHLART